MISFTETQLLRLKKEIEEAADALVLGIRCLDGEDEKRVFLLRDSFLKWSGFMAAKLSDSRGEDLNEMAQV